MEVGLIKELASKLDLGLELGENEQEEIEEEEDEEIIV